MNMAARYPFQASEAKWQDCWRSRNTFAATDAIPKKPYYVLEMFPYPSGNIHMGHVRNYTLGDVIARFRKAQGYDVLHPMGWDAFGLPAENAAIQNKVHPKVWTDSNMATMRQQLQRMGLAYDWSRELATCSPDYYKFEQMFFLAFLDKGLAYRKKSYVNWDPVENTVLANEQVIDGRGWRSGALVEKREQMQWFLKITAYADALLDGLQHLNGWPEKVRLMQEKWIGKSVGAHVDFRLTHNGEVLRVFTTRPDTLFGAAFVAISPNHPLAAQCAAVDAGLADFIKACNAIGTSEAAIEQQEKQGYKTTLTVEHPFKTNASLPVYVANFVLMDYGTGAVFGCPAHDQRDFEFARKYDLPIIPVVRPDAHNEADITQAAYTGDGVLYHSDFLDGLPVVIAKQTAIARLEQSKAGSAYTTYRLRDWSISRQRYWGCPIPVVHCPSCGVVPVPAAQLPVTLPEDITLGKPGNPLADHPTWKHTICPTCGGKAERETDTFDTFFESSWYFLRFTCKDADQPFDKNMIKAWLPVDQYIGGVEHAVLHLLYARFFVKALRDCGFIDLDEPFNNLMTQGMICHATYKAEDGTWLFPHEVAQQDKQYTRASDGTPVQMGRSEKMSKSLKNVVDPAYIIDTYGADTARLFMLSDCPPERDMDWTDAGIEGCWRYVNRLWKLVADALPNLQDQGSFNPADLPAGAVLRQTHQTIAAVTEDIEHFRMNRAVARIRELSNALEDFKPASVADWQTMRFALETLVQLLAPMLPHLAEELWQHLGYQQMVIETPWPVADARHLIVEQVTIAIQINGKLRGTIELPPKMPQDKVQAAALAQPNVAKQLEGQTVRKVIVIPDKVVNVVV